ncbi:MAG: nicotinamide mononucleotide transporter [Oscillospiraceae bacterium]|nr:nicotinamide mononucleotide transporter [Oscillospiraceae bacterium]MBQ6402402.1 nicotinamide mononucleotide transporter [Oscillospiraceae bacterium]
MNRLRTYFTPFERALWLSSAGLIVLSAVLFRGGGALFVLTSLIGVTSLIFAAKGNPISQALMIVFSLLYGWISWTFSYYGEMITYLGMTMPMAAWSLIAWLRHPFAGSRAQVTVNRLKAGEIVFLAVLTTAVTVGFYFILRAFHTANLLPSTLSVATSFAAAYLTARRSAWFALAYAMNDLVLIVLWLLASLTDPSYFTVLVCFAVFFVNDLYGFLSWRRMRKHQKTA